MSDINKGTSLDPISSGIANLLTLRPMADPPDTTDPTAFVDEELPDFEAEEAEMRAKLGQSTWYFLHTMAAKYPVKADDQTKERMRIFMDIFSKVYPCPHCSEHFQQLLASNPPDVS